MYLHYMHYIHKYINHIPPYQACKLSFCLQSCKLAKLARWIPLFMRYALSLLMTKHT